MVMTYKNRTDRNSHLEWLMRDRINCIIYSTMLYKSDQQATETGTYFSRRFK